MPSSVDRSHADKKVHGCFGINAGFQSMHETCKL